jgi:PhzF family phenazine biosynthesis protein
MTQRRFMQLDVFASTPFSGNPLAVVLDGTGLSTDEMQRITDWTNLSEATFLLPPTDQSADYRVRIFCPGRELPFAGHPTLGSCAAWLAGGGIPGRSNRIVQECGAGLIAIRRDGDRLAFAAPPITRSGPVDPSLLMQRLDRLGLDASDIIDSAWIDNGPGWMGILLESADAVLDVELPTGPVPDFDVGLLGLHPGGSECALEVRGLFSDGTGRVREDPVTGSLNASAAQWLLESGRLAAPYIAAQGQVLGRRGRVYVDAGDGEVWIGGRSVVTIDGVIDA